MENELTNMERAEVLTQALPYIKKYSGKIVVIKYGRQRNLRRHHANHVAYRGRHY